MPRPTPAQLAYGSVTVVGSTLAMLLLSGSASGPGIAAMALAGLALGLLVAMTVGAPRGSRAARRGPAASAGVRETLASTAAGEHSLRR